MEVVIYVDKDTYYAQSGPGSHRMRKKDTYTQVNFRSAGTTHMSLRLKELEMALQSMQSLSELDVRLEQYPTPPSMAAAVLFAAQFEHGDITGKTVLDLGCGNGIFAIGAALLGAERVIGIDIQSTALKVARQNAVMLGTEDIIEWILGDVANLELSTRVDTIVTNPPFGVKRRGADLTFLRKALAIANIIYSIHLSGEKNRKFLRESIEQLGGTVTQIETFEFPISRIYEFHTKQRHYTKVDLYRICNG